MIKSISFQNYKAYKEGKIDFKPITILLGANSSGKSSILQLILLLLQTLDYEGDYKSALKINGKYTNLGELENIFRNKNLDHTLTFSLTVSHSHLRHLYYPITPRRLKRNIESDIFDLFQEFSSAEFLILQTKNEPVKIKDIFIGEEISKVEITNIIKEIKRLRKSISNIDFQTFLSENLSKVNRRAKKRFEEKVNSIKDLLSINIKEYSDSYDFLNEISQVKIHNAALEFDIKYSKKTKNLEVSRLTALSDGKKLIEFEIQINKGHTKYVLNSDVFNQNVLDKYRVIFGRNVEFEMLQLIPKTDSKFNKNKLRRRRPILESYFCNTILKLFNSFYVHLDYSFESNRVNYISPLRAFPKRYYFLDESNISNSLDSIDGDNLTEILKKEKKIITKVNKWLNTFGLEISVEDVKEVIHKLKVTQNGLNLDITDVGFGISQVLPIIVQGFLSESESLTIIEQPEIHLHPMMQAELADLFIDVINSSEKKGKTLLIETHSESILKRLRRRIAEGKIKNTDVAIYFVHGRKKKSSSAKIERIEISATGAFDWPKEFYSTDLIDTHEFLKHQ